MEVVQEKVMLILIIYLMIKNYYKVNTIRMKIKMKIKMIHSCKKKAKKIPKINRVK